MIAWVGARRPSNDRVLAWIGIVLGLIAFWVALPPVKIRTEWIPPVIGLFGITCGVGVLIRGHARRLAWFAIVISVLGIGLGVLATRSSEGHLDQVIVWSALTAAMLRYATPLAVAAMGGIFSERSGVVNIGLEGMMLSGAFFGILGADKFNSWQLGLLCAALSGAAFALIHAFFLHVAFLLRNGIDHHLKAFCGYRHVGDLQRLSGGQHREREAYRSNGHKNQPEDSAL